MIIKCQWGSYHHTETHIEHTVHLAEAGCASGPAAVLTKVPGPYATEGCAPVVPPASGGREDSSGHPLARAVKAETEFGESLCVVGDDVALAWCPGRGWKLTTSLDFLGQRGFEVPLQGSRKHISSAETAARACILDDEENSQSVIITSVS